MYEAGLWIAAGIGFLSLLLGSRTAIPLLASFGLVAALCYYGWGFDRLVWRSIDLMVIAVIALLAYRRREIRRSDAIIVCLFLPAWVAYLLPADMRAALLWIVVVGQFLLTVPAEPFKRIWGRIRAFNRGFNPWNHLDLRQACT